MPPTDTDACVPSPPLPCVGGPLDGEALHVGSASHVWVLRAPISADPREPRVLLAGDTPLVEHWAVGVVRHAGWHLAPALEYLDGVYLAACSLWLEWVALHPRCDDLARPAGVWRGRAALCFWEALAAHELIVDVAILPELLRLRAAWRGCRDVERRVYELARVVYLARYGGDLGPLEP